LGVFFGGGGDDKDGWITMDELGETLKMHNLKRKGSEVGDAPNVYLHYSQIPFKKVVPFFPAFFDFKWFAATTEVELQKFSFKIHCRMSWDVSQKGVCSLKLTARP